MKKRISKLTTAGLIGLAALLIFSGVAYAQSYLFKLNELRANVFIQADGSTAIDYVFVFANAPGAHAIDFVDVGMPNGNFSLNGATADVDGSPVELSRSDYEGNGSGFAVVLGGQAIGPGQTGAVHVSIPKAGTWLRKDSQGDNYASFVFSPTWFGSEYVQGTTNITVAIHLPPGVKPTEPRWHAAPGGFSEQPQASLDENGQPVYTWNNPQARADREYEFGASFPAQYVPAAAIKAPSLAETLGIDPELIGTFGCCGAIFLGIIAMIYAANASANRRKLKYLPPKIAIEGMGIKRGLTAVEAAILLEQPLDKVMTMILFGLIKKNAASVVKRDPLEISPANPLPEGLYPYEADFIKAFMRPNGQERRNALQTMTIDLVKSVAAKMKGFSNTETVAYYKDIMERAWKQVEDAQTPEVKSEAYEKYMEWTMLDKDYDDRTRRVFTGPVYMPMWWPRYDPTFHSSGGGAMVGSGRSGSSSGGGGGGGVSMPTLPGSAFAASVVNGVQGFSAGVLGNLQSFTGNVTEKTNPVPVSTSSSRGGSRGGGGCACACACAGCACACAGGGR